MKVDPKESLKIYYLRKNPGGPTLYTLNTVCLHFVTVHISYSQDVNGQGRSCIRILMTNDYDFSE